MSLTRRVSSAIFLDSTPTFELCSTIFMSKVENSNIHDHQGTKKEKLTSYYGTSFIENR